MGCGSSGSSQPGPTTVPTDTPTKPGTEQRNPAVRGGTAMETWAAAQRSAAVSMLAANARAAVPMRGEVQFVFGNDAGDLDSVVSALGAAFFLASAGAVVARPVATRLVCPLITFPRDEFRLRGDAVMLFKAAGWAFDAVGAPEALLFWDEVDWAAAALTEPAACLTDHNALSAQASAHFQPASVLAVLDHHNDEQLYPAASPRLIDNTLGSACTVVYELLTNYGSNFSELAPTLELLLFSTILIDTRNLNPEGKKFNERDAAALPVMAARLYADGSPPPGGVADQAGWFEALMAARYDTTHLGLSDLLKLDYKQVAVGGAQHGFSAVFTSIREAVETDGVDGVAAHMAEHSDKKGGLGLLNAFFRGDGPDMRKGIAILGRPTYPPQLLANLVGHLAALPAGLPPELVEQPLFAKQRITTDGLRLTDLTHYAKPATVSVAGAPATGPMVAFEVSADITRKTLLPIVKAWLESQEAGAGVGEGCSA